MKQPRFTLIGYWRGEAAPEWPDPVEFVDRDWDPDERDDVADHLGRGFVHRASMGYAPCRLCNREDNGNLELTDGTYVWPEGLRHYVVDHGVRLPATFVAHVRETREVWERAGRDEGWWRGLRRADVLTPYEQTRRLCAAWLERLVDAFPGLRPVLDEHLEFTEGEMLPYLVIADVVRWLVDRLPSDRETCQAILDWIEREFPDVPDSVQTLIVVGGLEVLPDPGSLGAELREMLGPVLREQDPWGKPAVRSV